MSPFHFPFRNGVPSEVEMPVKAAPGHIGRGDVFERVVRDYVDYRRHYPLPKHSLTTHHPKKTASPSSTTEERKIRPFQEVCKVKIEG